MFIEAHQQMACKKYNRLGLGNHILPTTHMTWRNVFVPCCIVLLFCIQRETFGKKQQRPLSPRGRPAIECSNINTHCGQLFHGFCSNSWYQSWFISHEKQHYTKQFILQVWINHLWYYFALWLNWAQRAPAPIHPSDLSWLYLPS